MVESRWIVGVGGELRDATTIYDLTTSVESCGPWVGGSKLEPILIPLHGYLYILLRRPVVHYDNNLDFPPWFERLYFKHDTPTVSRHGLPPPPIFPCRINPIQYLHPSDVRVAAYAAIGSHILISVSASASTSVQQQQQQQQDKGTCAFDVDRGVWEMVHDKNLPFVGHAVPLGGHLFVARSKGNHRAASFYHIQVLTVSGELDAAKKSELRIVKLPLVVVPEGRLIVPGAASLRLGEGSFSSF